MDNNKIVTLLVVLAVGVGIGYLWRGISIQEPQADMHTMSGGAMMQNSQMGMGNAMDDMMAGLTGLKGDDFDKVFLSQMITHHEGAVVMAEAALRDANHAELKSMANDIIEAQTRETEQMKNWQRVWYGQ